MTIILDRDRGTTIDRRPVIVTVTGMPSGEVRLAVVDGLLAGAGTARREAFAVIRQRPGVTVLPRVERPLTLCLVPQGAAEFATGSTVTVRITTEATADSAGDDVLIESVDVSGLSERPVVVLDVVDAQRLSVTAQSIVRERPMTPLASAARAATRAQLRERTVEPLDVRIAVDTSASMAGTVARGTVDALVDVLTGLAQVVAPDRDVDTSLVTDSVQRVVAPDRELASATRSAIERAGYGAGFRSALALARPGSRTVTYVVTDSFPADVAALRDAQQAGTACHLVLCADGGEPEPPGAAGLPTTRVGLAAEPDVPGRLERDGAALGALVGSLLQEVWQ